MQKRCGLLFLLTTYIFAPRVWNDLPADIVSAPSLAIFKRR